MKASANTRACIHCGEATGLVASSLGLCRQCIVEGSSEVLERIRRVHGRCREGFGLPAMAPHAPEGVECTHCVNRCVMGLNERGFCALKINNGGQLTHIAGLPRAGSVECYYDPLPTNCVASWVCAEGEHAARSRESAGWSYSRGRRKNLAVFYNSCTFNCLFCQNWHFRERAESGTRMSAAQLASHVDKDTACVCYFGGDPTSQILHAIQTSRIVRRASRSPAARICWETNGSMNRRLCRVIAEISWESGGCIKFDLKALDERLHVALTGASNRSTLENFQWLATFGEGQRESPFLIASTLLLPGYIDKEEVYAIARFIAALDAEIPYSLLGFYPQFYMHDLPVTSRSHAQRCLEAAQEAGLKRVNIGNRHLLSSAEY